MPSPSLKAAGTRIYLLSNTTPARIIADNLYDHVMKSLPNVCTRQGVRAAVFIRHQCTWSDTTPSELYDIYEVCKWAENETDIEVLSSFDTDQEAEDAKYEYVYQHYFIKDDQRDTRYWIKHREARVACQEQNVG